jgi:hypothetical protein
MAAPRVFVSSTCYDLAEIRDSLVDFILSFGFEPMLSERGDVFYHPDFHTHESCLSEVGNCQLFLLIIGGRFGGAYKSDPDKSIVNAEYITAREEGIPVFTFVKRNVYGDHHVYVSNRNEEILSQISFPSIEKQENALKIFKFIDQVRSATVNNGYFAFDFARDITELLRKQWAGMFFDFLQKRETSNQLSVATSLIKNVSLASEKVEDLLKSLYRHIDEKGAAQTIETVEHRATAKKFFSRVLLSWFVEQFDGDPVSALAKTPRNGKWYEYICSALGGALKKEGGKSEQAVMLGIRLGGAFLFADSEDPKSEISTESQKLQTMFLVVSKMSDDEIADVVRDTISRG